MVDDYIYTITCSCVFCCCYNTGVCSIDWCAVRACNVNTVMCRILTCKATADTNTAACRPAKCACACVFKNNTIGQVTANFNNFCYRFFNNNCFNNCFALCYTVNICYINSNFIDTFLTLLYCFCFAESHGVVRFLFGFVSYFNLTYFSYNLFNLQEWYSLTYKHLVANPEATAFKTRVKIIQFS